MTTISLAASMPGQRSPSARALDVLNPRSPQLKSRAGERNSAPPTALSAAVPAFRSLPPGAARAVHEPVAENEIAALAQLLVKRFERAEIMLPVAVAQNNMPPARRRDSRDDCVAVARIRLRNHARARLPRPRRRAVSAAVVPPRAPRRLSNCAQESPALPPRSARLTLLHRGTKSQSKDRSPASGHDAGRRYRPRANLR